MTDKIPFFRECNPVDFKECVCVCAFLAACLCVFTELQHVALGIREYEPDLTLQKCCTEKIHRSQ